MHNDHEKFSNQIKTAAGTIIVLLFALLLAQSFRVIPTDNYDAMVYWVAGERMRDGGSDLYESSWETRDRPYIYPPTFAAMYAPLTYLDNRPDVSPMKRSVMKPYPFPVGLVLWGLLHGVALVGSLMLLCRLLPVDGKPDIRVAAGVCLGSLATVLLDTHYGNINIFVLLALSSGVALHLRNRSTTAGIILGLAAMAKIMPLMVIPVLLTKGSRRRLLLGVTCGLAIGFVLPLVWTIPEYGFAGGLQTNVEMFTTYAEKWVIPSLETQKYQQDTAYAIPNNSPVAAFHRLFGEGVALKTVIWDEQDTGPLLFSLPKGILRICSMAIPASLYLASLALAWRKRSVEVMVASTGLAFTAASMANVLFWHYHILGMGMVGGVIAVNMIRHRQGRIPGTAVLVLTSLGFTFPFIPILADNRALFSPLMLYGMPTWSLLTAMVLSLCLLWRIEPSDDDTKPPQQAPAQLTE